MDIYMLVIMVQDTSLLVIILLKRVIGMNMKDKILKALENVNDPEIHKSLVELDMVGEIDIDGESVLINILLTTFKCPMKTTISDDIKSAVLKIEGVKNVEIIFDEMSKSQRESLIAKIHGKDIRQNPLQGIRMIAIGSGKGGVGKSSVTVGIAIALRKMGYKVGIIDADILGFSIPRIMGIKYKKPVIIEGKLLMPIEKDGIRIMSMGNLVEKDDAFIWRSPMLAKALSQFIYDVYWGELDYMLIDMPPGTGDMPLNIIQSNPNANILIVTTPQEFASGVSKRLGLMAKKADCNIIGVVENMSYFICDNCDKKHFLYGEGKTENLCKELDTVILGSLPFVKIEEELNYVEDKKDPSDKTSETAFAFKDIAQNIVKRCT
ncbi:UNVERIFIED_CONTAM: ATP-binding protein involved in chromosome partitioning [Acetivibrio alkalicellulosi]